MHYFFDFLFPCSALHISMCPGRSSVLRIGSNSTRAFGSGRTGGESDSLAMMVHWVAPREPPFPLVRISLFLIKHKLVKQNESTKHC